MRSESWLAQSFLVSLLFLKTGFTAEFEISVPREPQLAILGQYVVLDCSFPVGKTWTLDSTVITWQRGLEVIHSFYYGQDQLERQSHHYYNRTSLYHSEIERGNASLRLERTNLGDSGHYTCSVSTLLGNQKKTFQLKLAAFYPEPHQDLTVSPDSVDLLLISKGGYPHPTVQWLDDRHDVISDIVTNISVDTVGLYTVFSILTIQKPVNTTFTFVLENKDLGQEIRREITLRLGGDVMLPVVPKERCRWIVFLPFIFLLIFAFLVLVLLWKSSFEKTRTIINSSQKGNHTGLLKKNFPIQKTLLPHDTLLFQQP
ncbi:CD276 antigen-like [Esox lucius]|uniref:Ig-like domain-containing protein n=1 Tax=Esox lucius TaxID=8010 RepID=A0AAY5KF99_ESOLU|nr:CD276 antigen-like [Esox lucius]